MFETLFDAQKKYFNDKKTLPLNSRIDSLTQLEDMIVNHSDDICEALYSDLKKPKLEAYVSEVSILLGEIKTFKKKLAKWMKPKKVRTPLLLQPAKSEIRPEPLGVTLIIGPWNYPFQLAINPLIGALAAGNCAVIKPSELTPNTAKLMKELVAKHFNEDHVTVVEGGIPETTELLKIPFDHIFFTGSTPVGKIVMQAAAKNLSPVTLELGGKSPAIVCADADLELAARRIVWGKFFNTGQTCVAPDYVYVDNKIKTSFIDLIKKEINSQYGANPKESTSYGRIVNLKNLNRLIDLIDKDKVAHGGNYDENDLFLEPTVLTDVKWNDKIMSEEIFGPIMPILTFETLNETFQQINKIDKPLSAYLFTNSQKNKTAFQQEISFGGGCVNDVIMHLNNHNLPFGGVGHSGIGNYHGKYSFDCFSHYKSILYRTKHFDLDSRYAPYTDKKFNLLKKVTS